MQVFGCWLSWLPAADQYTCTQQSLMAKKWVIKASQQKENQPTKNHELQNKSRDVARKPRDAAWFFLHPMSLWLLLEGKINQQKPWAMEKTVR